MNSRPITNELHSSQIPALHLLISMGYHYLPPDQCFALRGRNSEVLLKNILIEVLKTRFFIYKGERFPLSPNAIDQIVRELTPGLNEGLLSANERIYDKLALGVTVTEFIGGKRHSTTIPLVDWNDLNNNRFHVTDEFEVLNAGGTGTRRPDIVCFVNGIPMAVIEAKRPDAHNAGKDMIAEGISQQIRNQKNEEIPHLFAYSQLLFSINGQCGRYGTCKTPSKFWARWRDEDLEESFFKEIKNRSLLQKQKELLLGRYNHEIRDYFERLWSSSMLPSDQDRLLVSLLNPERFLEFVRYFILFDKKMGKIAARYQQFFGVKRLVEQVKCHRPDGGREGGVVWHTTGSGKSFTMVFLCKTLLFHDELKKCRIIVVTDRIDLEKQLSKTFLTGGAFGSEIATKIDGEKAKVRTGRELANRIGKSNDRIIFTIINKFNTASKLAECYNTSENIIVIVDEGHRSQGGETHERMHVALPNAAYIAFTGTPLLKDNKTTNKFGPIVHAYTMKRAVEDGTVTPLLYEERKPELDINEKAIDKWFDKITDHLSESQKSDLKRKFSTKGFVYGAENRIELIAWDISSHFKHHIALFGQGLKGQLATDSKQSAIRYKKCLDAIGQITSAVIMSPPDTREGHSDVDEKTLPEVQEWWKNAVGSQREEEYTKKVIDAFASDGAPELLIVVDKLLTGFDEPKNSVLYIDKPLKQHNLIQAIARVNRLHEAKQYGLLIDYRGILKELDTAIKEYQDLETYSQGGYDIDDIQGLYDSVSFEYKRLPKLYDRLWDIFKDVKNRQDLEQYRQILIPQWVKDDNGDLFDNHQKIREDFYEALTEFGICLKIALSSRSFFEDSSFTEEDIKKYKNDLRHFTNIRKTARHDALETVDYSLYEKQIYNLVDRHVVGESIQESQGVYLVNDLGRADEPKSWSKEKIRNETDIIRSRVKKTIEQDLAQDPYAQVVFSEMLKRAILETEALFDHPYKQYALFKNFENKLNSLDMETIPSPLKDNRHARAYYGVFRLILGDDFFETIEHTDRQHYVNEALFADHVVETAVSELSLNIQNMEAEIRKELLPRLFKRLGMDKAKEVIQRIIQISRIGFSKNEELPGHGGLE
ncbi:MAG: type I restriction endonuclease subunit R [Desulfobacteraceae bacterium]|nr:type I restriction endonuclease subunit R [Desulfobacteraceae bacterium]